MSNAYSFFENKQLKKRQELAKKRQESENINEIVNKRVLRFKGKCLHCEKCIEQDVSEYYEQYLNNCKTRFGENSLPLCADCLCPALNCDNCKIPLSYTIEEMRNCYGFKEPSEEERLTHLAGLKTTYVEHFSTYFALHLCKHCDTLPRTFMV